MSFAVHGTAELAFTGAAAGLVVAGNPVAGALAGSLVVAALIATLGARPRERDSAIGSILAFGLGIGVLLLGFSQGFASAATNILFGNIFGVSGTQLLILVAIGLVVVAVMAVWYRPLLFASIDPRRGPRRPGPPPRPGVPGRARPHRHRRRPGGRHPARAQPGHHAGRGRPAPVGARARELTAVQRQVDRAGKDLVRVQAHAISVPRPATCEAGRQAAAFAVVRADMVMKSRDHQAAKYRFGPPYMPGSRLVPLTGAARPDAPCGW